MNQDGSINILVLGGLFQGSDINVNFVGQESAGNKLGEKRVRLIHVNLIQEIPKDSDFDLIIGVLPNLKRSFHEHRMEMINRAIKMHPTVPVILYSWINPKNHKEIMEYAKKIGAQIEFCAASLCVKVRTLFFPQDFIWDED
ncbi:hypothetical protein JW977_00225 [Candidatus Falkowbacteria bacterium]|nr:hypothetical protein [Candidatus Falkowbacteria bacterium]